MAKNKGQYKLRIKLFSYDVSSIDQSASNIVDVIVRTGAKLIGPVPLPTKIEKFAYPRSHFGDKRSFEKFERRTHVRLLDVVNPTSNTINELSTLKLPSGVGIKIQS